MNQFADSNWVSRVVRLRVDADKGVEMKHEHPIAGQLVVHVQLR